MINNKKVHLIGIGGVSMSSIALMLHHEGFIVTGSDQTESNITKKLIDEGIQVLYGHHEELVKDADIIVYTAAIKETDPERIAIKTYNKTSYERSEFLGLLMKNYKNNLCISGTHGKSTTTGMVSQVFLETDFDATIQIGASLKALGSNTRIGKNDYFIVESCEYVDSFLKFHPTSIIVTNIDSDHLDYFKNLDNIKNSFNKYVNLLDESGILVKNNDDENSNDLQNHTKAKVITYGINNEADYMAKNITINDLGHYSFDIYYNNEFLININLNVIGIHNVSNALAAFALSHEYIKDINLIKTGLEKFTGVGRRFEYHGKYNNANIFDDYAHHPSEIKTTYESSTKIKHNKTWAVFQPHTYSRTKNHLDEFAEILSKFDNIIIAPIYSARETNTFNINEQMLVDKIKLTNNNAIYIDSFDKITEYLKENIQDNDLIITIGAGPINKVAQSFFE